MLFQLISLTLTVAVVCFSVGSTFAADDVVVGNALPPHLRNLNIGRRLDGDTIERMVFGTDGKSGRKNLESQIQVKIRELDRRYETTDEIRNKLALAGRVDKMRFLKSLDELKQKASTEEAEGKKWQEIQMEAAGLRARAHDLYGASSFFRKASKTLLADSAKRDTAKTGSVATTKDGNIAPLMRAEDLADPNRVQALGRRRVIGVNRENLDDDDDVEQEIARPRQVRPARVPLGIQLEPMQAAPINVARIKKLVVRKSDSAKAANESGVDALAPVNAGGE